MRRDLVKMWGNRTNSLGKSALFRVDKRVYPGCYVENLSTMIVENLVETVEKPIIKHSRLLSAFYDTMEDTMEKFAREREQTPDRAERTDTLVWGKNAVTELLKSGGAVDTVYLTDAMPQAVAGYYTALSKESGAVVKRVPANKLQKMCGTPDHQGVAARAAEVAYASLDDLFKAAQAKDEPPFLVLCDGVEDPHNLGAIVRSAYLCGPWSRHI